jgi:hypothetical protein
MSGSTSALAIALLVALLTIDRLARWEGTLAVAASTTPATARELTREGPITRAPQEDAIAESNSALATS